MNSLRSLFIFVMIVFLILQLWPLIIIGLLFMVIYILSTVFRIFGLRSKPPGPADSSTSSYSQSEFANEIEKPVSRDIIDADYTERKE